MPSLPDRDQWLEWSGLKLAAFPNIEEPRRRIWFSPKFDEQLKAMGNWELDQDKEEGPKQQVEIALNNYAEGAHRLQDGWHYKALRPAPFPIYELRTRDVRIFGFLIGRGEFCAVIAARKADLRRRKDYEPMIQTVIDFVAGLTIPPPKYSKDTFDGIFR